MYCSPAMNLCLWIESYELRLFPPPDGSQPVHGLHVVSGGVAADVRGTRAIRCAPRAPHFPAKAKRVIFMYMPGGVSHVDSFDYKPKLIAAAEAKEKGKNGKLYVRPHWDFKPRGKCGIMVSDLFPHIGDSMDDICLIRSMHGDHNDHFQATLGIHTGSVTVARPSIGSWVSYGLGTENQNLPSFVVLAPKMPYTGAQAWSSNFLPGCHSGTRVTAGADPVPDLTRRAPDAAD